MRTFICIFTRMDNYCFCILGKFSTMVGQKSKSNYNFC